MASRWTSLLTRLLAFATAVLAVLAAYVVLFAPPQPDVPASARSTADGAASMIDADTSLQQAPDFALPTLAGDTLRLSAYRGQVVVLNFWATWCPPCREEIPLLVDLQREWESAGLQVVGVSLDEDGFAAVRPFARAMDVNYPMVVDDGTVARRYGGVRALPTTFLIGPTGRVHGYAPGLVTEAMLRPRVETLLAQIDD